MYDEKTKRKTTPAERIQMWCELMDFTESVLRAGLRRKVGPDGDVEAAFREWYQREMEQRDRDRLNMKKRWSH
ncbi:MAG: hypothetical protein QF473_17520 [Planctomycetota bacterium]|jgi:hypothetical protein|nr:hypothetical protein [Planctomycetota bacterium]